MLNPKFIEKVHAKLASVVQGVEGADKECALSLLAERYAEKIASPKFWSKERWLLRDSWFLAGEGFPSLEIHAEIQRNYLIALDPSAESEIDSMGCLLSADLWVNAAAADLAPEAKERIAKEIGAHYDDALEEELCSGKDGVPAHLAALKRLGDPRAAAKIFQKTCLTAREDSRLSKLLKPPAFLMTRYGGILPIFVCIFYTISWLKSEPISWFLFFGSAVVVKIVISQIVPRLVTINEGRRAYTWVLVSGVFLLTVACGLGISSDLIQSLGTLEVSLIFAAILAFFVYVAYSYSFLARKRLPFPEQQ